MTTQHSISKFPSPFDKINDGPIGTETQESPEEPNVDQEIVRSAADDVVAFEAGIQQLPPKQKMLALLRITKPLQISRLPNPFRAMSVTVQRKHMAAIQAKLEPFAFQCSSDFVGDEDDDNVNLTYIIPEPQIATSIQHTIERAKISAQLSVMENRNIFLRIDGKDLVSLHTQLNDHTSRFASDQTTESTGVLVDSELSSTRAIPKPTINDGIKTKANWNTSSATPESLEVGREANTKVELPRKDSCKYLMIDQNFLDDPTMDQSKIKELAKEISMIRKSSKFHITSYNGYLVIAATAERAGSSLTAMAHRLSRAIPLTMKIFLGTGSIEHQNDYTFSIKGFPNTNTRSKWDEIGYGVYMTPEFHELVSNPDKRDSALCEITARKLANLPDIDLLKLTGFRARVALKIGGPEFLIGYEKEKEMLTKALTDSDSKLTILKGVAGMGKSRLLDEVLKSLPGAVVCSLDPSGANTNGSALVTVAEQIVDQVKSNEPQLLMRDELKALMNFTNEVHNKRLRRAQNSPTKIVDLCVKALLLINEGQTPLILDDMHHCDRFSLQHITTIARRYIGESDGGKAVLSMRYEEMYEPKVVEDLKSEIKEQYRGNSVREVSLLGLNFSDSEISRDFAFYSLPKDLREGKTLGPWHEKLGRIAEKSPWVMKTLIDGILENPGKNLDTSDDVIILKGDFEEIINDILGGESDFKTFYKERLTRLSKSSRKLLDCVALMGGKVTDKQLKRIASTLGGARTADRLSSALQPLKQGGYIHENTSGGERVWELQHETTGDFVLQAFESAAIELDLSSKLYRLFGQDKQLHPDLKFKLSHNIAAAKNAPEIGHPFWIQYVRNVMDSFEDAETQNSIGRLHGVAQTVLDPRTSPAKIQEIIETGRTTTLTAEGFPTHIRQLIYYALFHKAKNASLIGKFQEAKDAIELFQKIYGHNNKDKSDFGNVILHELYIVAFENAYLGRDSNEMQRIYRENLSEGGTLDSATNAIFQMKMEIRKNTVESFAKAIQIYKDNAYEISQANAKYKNSHNGAPMPEFLQAIRLAHCRCEHEIIVHSLRKSIDSDIELQPGIANTEQSKKFTEILESLQFLMGARSQFPNSFPPQEETALLEQIGTVQAYLGHYQDAIPNLSEGWRQANQIGIHDQAARIAQIKSSVLVMQAISTVTTTASDQNAGITRPANIYNRRARIHLEKAFRNCDEESRISLAHLDKNNIYWLLNDMKVVQIAGLLCESNKYQLEGGNMDQIESVKEYLIQYVEKAVKAFERMVTQSKIQEAEGQGFVWHNDPEIIYYAVPYFGFILETAKNLDIPIPTQLIDTQNNPFLERSRLSKGFQFHQGLKDHRPGDPEGSIGEISRKREGFQKLAKHLVF